MHEKNIDLLREETNRLLALSLEMLQDRISLPSDDHSAGSGQATNIQKTIEILKGEQTKLANLEMIVAVVGTMKAGKSTTINAIVGTEVLPNRNRPMTALPTLIRHTPGQIEPILIFDNDKPIEKLFGELHQAMNDPDKQAALEQYLHGEGRDAQQLVEQIKHKQTFHQQYQGAEQIFEFLKGLNDLVRLSSALDVDFPFSDYDEVHELPVIEVEFAHLREMDQAKGRFTLLDTPGPNEADQPAMKKMLQEQLQSASAVLAVLDFTQLKSNADAEIRTELKNIAEANKGRLYALVNKFDQQDRNGDSEEDIKTFVAKTLMSGDIDEENVFPVSSRWGYLANRARHELSLYKKMPSHKNQAWVEDFGEEAFGRKWEREINDIEAVRDAANELWSSSNFSKPLEKVIKASYSKTAINSLESAVGKLGKPNTYISNDIKTRSIALTKSISNIDKIITLIRARRAQSHT